MLQMEKYDGCTFVLSTPNHMTTFCKPTFEIIQILISPFESILYSFESRNPVPFEVLDPVSFKTTNPIPFKISSPTSHETYGPKSYETLIVRTLDPSHDLTKFIIQKTSKKNHIFYEHASVKNQQNHHTPRLRES